ncbi:MAG: ATP-dependent metallopeptidase FtsH/Yme1/Tma family protein [Campylobacterota bacterium]|nr:ATP-dependent metallopeptidase FtsH/Yme1/Tma family protein [Campylobacterota bacterium]
MLPYKTNRLALYLSAFIIISLLLFAMLRDNTQPITLVDTKRLINNNKVEKIIVSKEFVFLTTNDKVYKIASSQVRPEMFERYKVEVDNGSNLIFYILFLVLFLGIGSFILRKLQKKEIFTDKNLKNTNSSTSDIDSNEPIQSIKSDVKFSDIGGISDVKIELEEIIDFMKNPTRYKRFGARMPRGVLLVGPPGVGKTMIAKAVAHEAKVPFYYQSGASFVQIYVGMGAKRVHELFLSAKNNSPSIIFIDEIDAVGKKRDGQRNDEREATLNQLLTEMDGFEGSSGVIVIAATNKIDILDDALLRAGRFDRRIFVELPTKEERESILNKYLDKVPHKLDVKIVATMTVGFNGASLATLVNEAALLSLRENDEKVTIDHFHKVKDKVMFGKKKLQMLSDKQKEYRVTYQAGKVLTATYFDLPFEKLMLSNEQLTPSTDEPLIQNELESRIKMHLSGIVACSLKFNEHASSAKNDLDEAKKLLDKMLKDYGMGSSLLYNEDESELIIRKLYDSTTRLIESNPNIMKKIEIILNEKESILKSTVREYINEIL